VFIFFAAFKSLFSEKLAFQTGPGPPGKKIFSGMRENLALQAALVPSPFLGRKETGCEKVFPASHHRRKRS